MLMASLGAKQHGLPQVAYLLSMFSLCYFVYNSIHHGNTAPNSKHSSYLSREYLTKNLDEPKTNTFHFSFCLEPPFIFNGEGSFT